MPQPVEAGEGNQKSRISGGTETILLVEDEAAVREIVSFQMRIMSRGQALHVNGVLGPSVRAGLIDKLKSSTAYCELEKNGLWMTRMFR